MKKATMLKTLKNNRGFALLMAVGAITVLVAVVIQANRDARFAVEATAVTRDRHTLTYNAMSGIVIASAILIEDKKKDTAEGFDASCEDWARPEYIQEVLDILPHGDGKPTSLKITDELGKIQVNALVKPPNTVDQQQDNLWDRALRAYVSSEEYDSEILNETRSIVEAIIDWLDQNDDPGFNGAENDYYQDLEEPYTCKNGFFSDINELMLVKGINQKLFDALNLPEYVTIFGNNIGKESAIEYDGKININTADIRILALLLKEGEEDRAFDVFDYREERDDEGKCLNNITSLKAYESEFGDIFMTELITVKSDIFRVESTSTVENTTKTVTAILQRVQDEKSKKWKCEILSWKDTS